METLNNFLTANGFESIGGVTGLTNKEINVMTSWDEVRRVVSVGGKQILVSTSENEVIECVKAELAKVAVSESNESNEAQDLAVAVAKELFVAEYKDEGARGKNIMIKDALSSIGTKIPASIPFSDFQKLVEACI